MKLSTLFLLCTGAAGVVFGDVPESAVTTAAGLYAAIEAAEEGDTIYMSAGEFVLTKTLVLDKNVKIVGAGADKTVIKMPAMAKFLSVDINHEDALLDGVALTGIYSPRSRRSRRMTGATTSTASGSRRFASRCKRVRSRTRSSVTTTRRSSTARDRGSI